MCGIKDSEKGADADSTEMTAEVESLPSARQASRLAEVISAAKAVLEDEGEVLSAIPATRAPQPEPQQEPLDKPHTRKQRMLTASMWILIILAAILALFVLTAPLHLGRYSGAHYWADMILAISYIALGISVIAVCVLISALNSWFRTGESQR